MDLRNSLNLSELGIDAETADKVVERTQSYISGAYIPKDRFDDVNNKYKQQKTMNATLNTQLEELKGVDVEGLNSKIAELQEANKKQQAEFDKQIQAEKLKNALDSAFKEAGAKNAKATRALLDMDKIKLTDNGLEGFKEQIDALKKDENTAFLFEQSEPSDPPSGFKPNRDPQDPPGTKSAGARAAERYNIQIGAVRQNQKGE